MDIEMADGTRSAQRGQVGGVSTILLNYTLSDRPQVRPMGSRPNTPVEGAGKSASHPAEVQVDCVETFVALHMRSHEVSQMRALFGQARMPKLTTILVDYKPEDDTASGAAGATPMVLDIALDRFPALEYIALTDAAAALTPSLASPLRYLTMGNDESTGSQLRLPLAPFLDCLASFSRLEILRIRECFAAPNPPPLGGPGARPVQLPLKDVVIADYPSNTGRIISRLSIPSSAKIYLRGEVRGASLQQYCSAFMAMLPRDIKTCLPALCSVANIEVLCNSQECYILGAPDVSNQSDDDHQITLQLSTDLLRDSDEDDAAAQAARGALLHTMLQNIVSIFPGTPAASRLKVFGPVDYIPLGVWHSVLRQFPSLRRLMVDDATLRHFPYALLDALHSPLPPTNQTVICPKLEQLEIYGDCGEDEGGEEGDPLRALFECLQWRMMHSGGGILRKLDVLLFSDTMLEDERFERYRARLAPLALDCEVAYQVMDGLRTRRD